jgi:RNA ligase (TIGR02306 family)
MSSLIVEVCRIDALEKHPCADRMEIATVKGWKVCVGKGTFKVGDKIVYIPPDSVLTKALSDRLGITKYLSQLPADENGNKPDLYRVRVARLRGAASYGTLMPVDDPAWEIGKDVADILGITKWEPPLDCTDGDAERPNPAFHQYFTLENWENFPGVLSDGEEVVLTEKIHGKNFRGGLIREAKDDGTMIWRFMAGSHDVRRKEMQTQRKRRPIRNPDGTPVMVPMLDKEGNPVLHEETGLPKEKEAEWFFEVTKRSQFFETLDKPGLKELMLSLCNGTHNIVIFGELYGSGVQDMAYGFENGAYDVRLFDITVDGRYLDYDAFKKACEAHGVATVPEIYRGPYSKEVIEKHVTGPTTLCAPEKAGKFKGREGIVFKATKEHQVVTEAKVFERAALKAVSFEYHERKDGTEFH